MLTDMISSRDGRAVCLYLPLTDKLLSYRVFEALNQKIESFNAEESYHITGLPVAEGAVGVEMFYGDEGGFTPGHADDFCPVASLFQKVGTGGAAHDNRNGFHHHIHGADDRLRV